MADQPASSATADPPTRPSVVVKKYANRRLYNTETSSYITLDNLADMIRAGRDFAVFDAKTGDDITRSVLTQIIVEEESKGSSMLPTNFLRSLIGFYGDSLQGVVPSYLDQAMSSFARQQKQMREAMQQTFGSFMPPGAAEMSRQNMVMMERAMSMFFPFARPGQVGGTTIAGTATAGTIEAIPGEGDLTEGAQGEAKQAEATRAEAIPAEGAVGADPQAAAPVPHAELDSLRREIEGLRAQLAVAHAELAVSHAPHPPAAPPSPEVQAFNVVADPPKHEPDAPDMGVRSATPLAVARGRRGGRKT